MQTDIKRRRHDTELCKLTNEEILLVQGCWNFLNAEDPIPAGDFTPLEAHLLVSMAAAQASMHRIVGNDRGAPFLFPGHPNMRHVSQPQWERFLHSAQLLKDKLVPHY